VSRSDNSGSRIVRVGTGGRGLAGTAMALGEREGLVGLGAGCRAGESPACELECVMT
jgi:ribosomal protein S5